MNNYNSLDTNFISPNTIIISHQIKYDVLARMTNEAFVGSTANSVNIYIDLYQMFLKLFRPNIQIIGKYSLSSLVMNLCAHYRWFYKKYYGVSTKIFLMYTNDLMRYNQMQDKLYNSKHSHQFSHHLGVKDYIATNTDILNIITKYFKDIYFIQSPYEVMAMIAENIDEERSLGNNNPNIIISTSKLLFQIPALDEENNTFVFYHKYSYNGIQATIISKQNALIEYLRKNKNVIDTDIVGRINPELLSIVFTLNGYKSRTIPNYIRIPTVIKRLCDAIEKGLLINSYTTDIANIYNIFKDKLGNMSLEELYGRFKALDLIYNKNVYKTSKYCKNKDWRVNLYNPEDIRRLNTTYFKNYPIDLERL